MFPTFFDTLKSISIYTLCALGIILVILLIAGLVWAGIFFKKNLLPERRLMKAAYVDNAYIFFDDVRESNFTFAYDNHIMALGYASLEERREAYLSVSAEEIRAAACEIFRPENLTLAVRANKKNLDVGRLGEIIKELS